MAIQMKMILLSVVMLLFAFEPAFSGKILKKLDKELKKMGLQKLQNFLADIGSNTDEIDSNKAHIDNNAMDIGDVQDNIGDIHMVLQVLTDDEKCCHKLCSKVPSSVNETCTALCLAAEPIENGPKACDFICNKIFTPPIDKTQRWKLGNNTKLEDKEGVWKSDDLWNFKSKDDLIYIENTSKAKVLGATSDGKVILEAEEDKAQQLWKKGEPDAEGYFTLQNSGEPDAEGYFTLLLTAISESTMEIKDPIYGPFNKKNKACKVACKVAILFCSVIAPDAASEIPSSGLGLSQQQTAAMDVLSPEL